MKIKITFLLLLFVLMFETSGTKQIPDVLIMNGERHNLRINPMESYFDKFPNRRPRPLGWTSALNRDYIATFEIIQNELWVINIETDGFIERTGCAGSRRIIEGKINAIPKIFDGEDKVKMDWFSGLIDFPISNGYRYVYRGYLGGHERYKLLEIQNGNLTRELNMNDEEYAVFRTKQFELYKKTDAYKKEIARISRLGFTEQQAEDGIRRTIIDYLDAILEE